MTTLPCRFSPMGIDPECCTHCGYLFDSHAPTTTECPTTREERIANRLSRLYAWRRA